MKDSKLNEWRKLRLKALIRDDHKCINCSSTEKLHVHHVTYNFNNENIRIVPLSSLFTLCKSCHNELHKLVEIKDIKNYNTIKRIKSKLSRFNKIKATKSKSQYSFLSEKDRLIQEKYDKMKLNQGEEVKKFKAHEIKGILKPLEVENKYNLVYASKERKKYKKKFQKNKLPKK